MSSALHIVDKDLILAKYNLDRVASIGAGGEQSESSQAILQESGRLKRIITDIFKDNSRILKLESHTFEEVVAELLRSQGYEVEITKRTRDGGYDLMAISMANGNFPLKFIVECKQYTTKKVGLEIVRQFMHVIDRENANKGIIATTSYFTKDGRKERDQFKSYLLDFKDRDDMLEWVRKYCEQNLFIGYNGKS